MQQHPENKENINKDAINLRAAFLHYRDELNLPFLHSFPQNSCQIASYLFAKITQDKYPASNIRIIEGADYKNAESHYWVLVDGYVYDLTGDQFDGIDGPIIGANENILAERFSIVKRSRLQDFQNGSHLGTEAQQLNAIYLLKTYRGLHVKIIAEFRGC